MPVTPSPTLPDSRAGRAGAPPYTVTVGPQAVDAAARGVVERNPPHGTLRQAQVFQSTMTGRPSSDDHGPSYLDTLGASMAADPNAILYRLCAADRSEPGTARASIERMTGGRTPQETANVRTRVTFSNPIVLDILIGDQEVLLGVPDRAGHPHLRAAIIVNDPDFVAAVTDWFDESVWDPPCPYVDIRGKSAEQAFANIGDRLAN